MIYFDNAATSFPKAPAVGEAMTRFLATDAANPGRAGHRMAIAAERMLDDARLKLTRLFKGSEPERMILTLNTTDALNIAIKGVLAPGSGADKPHVITTVLEHNSVSRPLQALADSGGIELTRVACDGRGFIDPADVRAALKPNTALIVMTHASNVLGTIQDAAAVGAIAREADILFLLDAAQTAGAIDIDVEALHADLLAFPGHKSLLGPTGTGGLYVGERVPAPGSPGSPGSSGTHAIRPFREGGTGGDSSSPHMPALYPYFLEGGTPNTVGIAGLSAGVDYVVQRGIGSMLAHERRQVQAILDRFGNDKRFTIYGPPEADKRIGTVSLNIAGYEPSDVGSILDDSFEIAVRPGLHCAPYCHRALGTFPSGTVRISPGPFNTDEELATLLNALDQVAG